MAAERGIRLARQEGGAGGHFRAFAGVTLPGDGSVTLHEPWRDVAWFRERLQPLQHEPRAPEAAGGRPRGAAHGQRRARPGGLERP